MALITINLPQLGDEYDGEKMRAVVEELERLIRDLQELQAQVEDHESRIDALEP